jgi:hypothetical protein
MLGGAASRGRGLKNCASEAKKGLPGAYIPGFRFAPEALVDGRSAEDLDIEGLAALDRSAPLCCHGREVVRIG